MCLYQFKLRNPRYQINEKNGGNVPIPADKRHLYIKGKCGWCKECRKEIANEWRNRLQEEWYFNKKAQFITLSFSPESIEKLENEIKSKTYKGLKTTEELDVNILAAYAIRMWSERWRKIHGKAPKHWLITELGHKNSERLHLHGIQWTENKSDIEKTWQYGNVFIGKYVNERSFNYITKYITKLDNFHEGYKQRIFTSKKIGYAYIETARARQHKFDYERTIMYYRNHQGIKFGLPRYWRQKLWTDKEREWIWTYNMNKNIDKIDGVEFDLTRQDEQEYREMYYNCLKTARETNEKEGFGNHYTGNRKYIITPIMKLKTSELLNYNKQKLVKWVERRLIEKIEPFTEKKEDIEFENGKLKICEKETARREDSEELSKELFIERIYYGQYIGNLTENERKINKELAAAAAEKLSLRRWRLKQKGLPY